MIRKNTARLGIVSIGLPYFDVQTATKHLYKTREFLQKRWDVTGPQDVVTNREMLDTAVQEFLSAGGLDVLVLQMGTFPDGEFPLLLAEKFGVPTILHSLPEPDLQHNVDLNSLCGVNLATYTLSAMGHPHSFLHGDPADDRVQQSLFAHIRAALALSSLRNTRIGLAGFHAPGFYPCVFDELLLRQKLGVTLDYLDLGEIRSAFLTGKRKQSPCNKFFTTGGDTLPDSAIKWMEQYYAALTDVFTASGKQVFAIRDWPELLDIDAPGSLWPALGWLMDDGFLLAPEGDVNAAITMQLANLLGETVPFFSDISAWDNASSSLLLWHYGGAPSLASNPNTIRYGVEGRQVEFTLKPGKATLLRLGMSGHKFRLLAVAGEILDKRVTIQRAGGWFKTMNTPAQTVINHILNHGWEHHFCLVHSDILTELKVFSKLSAIPLEVL